MPHWSVAGINSRANFDMPNIIPTFIFKNLEYLESH